MVETRGNARTENAAEPAAERFFGLMRIGHAVLALPISSIREAVRGQPAYGVLPVKAECLVGAIEVRGMIIPVLDLRHALGMPHEDGDADADHVIVVMQWQGRLLGLRVAELRGLARLRLDAFRALDTNGPGPGTRVVSQTIARAGEIVALLDERRIADLPDVPMTADIPAGVSEAMSKPRETILLFSCGRSDFGIDATCVDATLPAGSIVRGPTTVGFCLGTIDHQGIKVPVVDTMAAVGFQAGQSPKDRMVVVLRFGERTRLGLAVDAVRDLRRIGFDDLAPMPAIDGAGLFRGVLQDADGRQTLLLDMNRMRSDAALGALAGLCRPILTPHRIGVGAFAAYAGRPKKTASRSFLLYKAGEEHATPLNQVSEILTYPTCVAPFPGHGLIGVFTHRGRAIPLVCLGQRLGLAVLLDPADARVLLVQDGDRWAAFAVQSLRGIETGSLDFSTGSDAGRASGLLSSMVILDRAGLDRMVPHVDLAAETALLYSAISTGAADDPLVSSSFSSLPAWPGSMGVSKSAPGHHRGRRILP